MPISGILIVCRPADLPQVRNAIEEQEWADAHSQSADGRLVVTIEGDTTDEVMNRLLRLQRVPGVITAAMAEHYVSRRGFLKRAVAASVELISRSMQKTGISASLAR